MQVATGYVLTELGVDVDGAEGVVRPEAHGKQEEDKEGLFGGAFISMCVGKVRLVPGHPQQLQSDLHIGDHQHEEDEPEKDHQHPVEVGFPLGFAFTLLVLEAFVTVLFVLCRGDHGHQRHQ